MPSALDMLQVGEMSWTGSTEKLQPLKMKLDTSLMTRLRHLGLLKEPLICF